MTEPSARLAALSPDLLATLTPGGEIAWSNAAWERVAGTVDWPFALHPDDRPAGDAALRRAVLEHQATVEARVAAGAAFATVEFRLVADAGARTVHVCGRDVSARVEHREAQARLDAVTQSTRDAIVSADGHGRITFWSPGAERIFGRSATHALGKPLTTLMPERYRAAHRAGLARLAASGETRVTGKTFEVEGVRADGTEFPMELSLGHREIDGRHSFTATIRDISRQVRVRQRLRAVEERFAEAFDGAAAGMALVRPSGTVLQANRALCELLGAELEGESFDERVHPDDREAHRSRLDGIVNGRIARWSGDLRLRHADGRVLGVRAHAALIRSGDGIPMHFVITVEDVGAQRRMSEALALSERRYRALVENLPDTAIVLFDADLKPLVREGRSDGPPLTDAHRAALNGEAGAYECEAAGVDWEVRVAPLRDEDGRVIGGVSIARDVTRRTAAERELEQFAYVASHDLSEPLRMITSYLQLLQRRHGEALAPEGHEFVGYAVDGAQRMRTLIDDLLAWSRAGRGERAVAEVDTSALVARVAGTLEGGSSVAVGELPTVRADADQLGQVFETLIANALKFVPGERPPQVEVSAERTDPGWVFTVADNGIGVDERHASRIFGMFQRLHSREDYSGTGVGLAIARKVVERHGGRIWVEPREGGGSRFRFELPEAPA